MIDNKSNNSKLPSWITTWIVIASILVGLDCLYVVGLTYKLDQYIPNIILSLWSWYGESDSQYSQQGLIEGLKDNSWMHTQSLFNLFELIGQIIFLISESNIKSLLLIMIIQTCTLWKTLIYMSIIIHAPDPVRVVPGLFCLGYEALSENQVEVATLLLKDNCTAQFFKFQFNFWWIVMPLFVIICCCKKIIKVFKIADNKSN